VAEVDRADRATDRAFDQAYQGIPEMKGAERRSRGAPFELRLYIDSSIFGLRGGP
jgi:hypothetical protein